VGGCLKCGYRCSVIRAILVRPPMSVGVFLLNNSAGGFSGLPSFRNVHRYIDFFGKPLHVHCLELILPLLVGTYKVWKNATGL
jgi:hypothetical protein